jgi:hypothetical protein
LSSPQAYLDTISVDKALQVRARLTPAYQEGFRIIFLVGAASCGLAFFTVLFMMPQLELSEPDAKIEEEGRKTHQSGAK